MKKLIIILLTICIANSMLAQVAGNISYQNRIGYSGFRAGLSFPENSNIFVSVKGLANVKADSYVAIFSVIQAGKTTEEVNRLINERINNATKNFKTRQGVEIFVDMISFVPMYEYEAQKKLFSKTTYNEIPAGFEIKKNIHIKYSNPNFLDEVISIFANYEIYDLVKVDYYSNNIERVKRELMTKAKTVLKAKLANYESILSVKMDTVKKNIVDGYTVLLPVEMYKSYKSYQSFSNSYLQVKRIREITKTKTKANKSTTPYYEPLTNKEFDFVINPIILEPVIQVTYELKLVAVREKEKDAEKKYFFISPDGLIKELDLR